MKCSHCSCSIEDAEPIDYSEIYFNTVLCYSCISFFSYYTDRMFTTLSAFCLYIALKKNGLPVELEKYDGYKRIDIAIVKAKLNIEVDGIRHSKDSKQSLTDLKRMYYSMRKGYETVRIPNVLVNNNVNDVVNIISSMYVERSKTINVNSKVGVL